MCLRDNVFTKSNCCNGESTALQKARNEGEARGKLGRPREEMENVREYSGSADEMEI